MTRRRMVLLVITVLVGAQLVNRWHLRQYRDQVADMRLEGVDAGERVAAALLGGFRSFLVTLLWVRAITKQESQDFVGFQLIFGTLRELQGASPGLFLYQATTLALDIPRVLGRQGKTEERWEKIKQGIEVLRTGLDRYPDHDGLVSCAAWIFEQRLDEQLNPLDHARYMKDKELNPLEEDPLDQGIGYLSRLYANSDLSPESCAWRSLAIRKRLDRVIEASSAIDDRERERAVADVKRLREIVQHYDSEHGADSAGRKAVDEDLEAYAEAVRNLGKLQDPDNGQFSD